MDDEIIPLISSLWKELLMHPTSKHSKMVAVCTILQLYSSLTGIIEQDFMELTDGLGDSYAGPLPDQYSEGILRLVEEMRCDL